MRISPAFAALALAAAAALAPLGSDSAPAPRAASERAITQIALLAPLDTNRRAPSAESSRSFGALPKIRSFAGRVEIVSTTDCFSVSTTETVSELALAT